MAVHFQRVELFVTQPLGLNLLAAENAPLGFHVQTTQLVAHPLDGGFHFYQRDLRIDNLLLDAPPEDGCFARQVDQVFQLLGRHLDHFRTAALDLAVSSRRDRHNWFRTGLGGLRNELPTRRAIAGQPADIFDQQGCVRQRLFRAHRIEHVGQHIVAALQQADHQRISLHAARGKPFVERFKLVSKVAYRGNFDHPCATLEGVQVTQQVFDFQQVVRVSLPAGQCRAGAFDDVEPFLKEDFTQLGVMFRQVCAGLGR